MAVSRPHRAIYCLPLALLFLLPGCSKPPGTAKDGATANETSATSAPVPDADHQRCFACEGTGIGPCHASGCVKGQVECPGSCLRLTRGIWEHMQVTGHGPNELWQKFPNGPGQTMAWNQNHVGEVVVIQNGRAVNMGKCPKYGGAVFETGTGYLCERSQADKRPCKFKISKAILQQPIERAQAAKLLAESRTDLLDKFISKAGRPFPAFLVMDDMGKVTFEFPPRGGEDPSTKPGPVHEPSQEGSR